MEAHTRNLAAELAGTGVTVNVYRPGIVDTVMAAWVRAQNSDWIGVRAARTVVTNSSGARSPQSRPRCFPSGSPARRADRPGMERLGSPPLTPVMPADPSLPRSGFHPGELAMQRRAGAKAEAYRLRRMVEPAELDRGAAGFLSRQTFAALTGRDTSDRLWISPLIGPPGFLYVPTPDVLGIAATIAPGLPLETMPAGQPVGVVVVDFPARRRLRINGTLSSINDGHLLVAVEQAYGNCPQYIQARALSPRRSSTTASHAYRGSSLRREELQLVRSADTFFLGTTHPECGADASHRGGAPGFVRAEPTSLWWPDYPGNNMFNSFGNVAVNPEAALLFFDFDRGRTLQLSGIAQIDWGPPDRAGDDGHTGRIARYSIDRVVAGDFLDLLASDLRPYPRNPGPAP